MGSRDESGVFRWRGQYKKGHEQFITSPRLHIVLDKTNTRPEIERMQLLEEGVRATCALAPATGLSISIWIWPPGKKTVEFAGYLNLHPALGVVVVLYQPHRDRPLHTR
jgi:hypothetical protein